MTRPTSSIALLLAAGIAGCSGKSDQTLAAIDAAVVGDDGSDVTCGGKATPFVLPVTARTPGDEYSVTLTASDPPKFGMRDNAWTLRVDDASGSAASGVSFNVVPWMTEHNHGAVKAVIVTEVGGGTYEAKPININMPGIWDIRVEFPGDDGGTPPRAVFSFCASAR
jgi:hypothetical protein